MRVRKRCCLARTPVTACRLCIHELRILEPKARVGGKLRDEAEVFLPAVVIEHLRTTASSMLRPRHVHDAPLKPSMYSTYALHVGYARVGTLGGGREALNVAGCLACEPSQACG